MKTKQQFKKFVLTFLLASLFAGISAQSFEVSKTLNKKANVQSDVSIELENYAADLQIRTTSENNVSIKTTVEISGKSKEDVDKVIAAIENFKFKKSGNSLQINTRYYKSKNTVNNRSTIVLQNGDKVKIKEIKLKHELYIPKSAQVNLNNKYGSIEFQTMEGNVNMELYNSKLFAEEFYGELNIEAKYSKIKLKNIGTDSKFNFYDTDIVMETCKNLSIKSKYSKYEIKESGDLVIDSYDDKFEVIKMNSLSFLSKYSDFESEADLEKVRLEIYDCNVTVNSAKNAVVNGKYSDVVLGDINNFKADDLYDNNIYLGNTKQIEIGKSRYSLYEIKSVSNFKLDDSYDDNIKAGKLNSDFSGFALNGKYGKLQLDANNVPFRVEFKIKYPKFEIPESLKVTRHIEKSSELELVAGDTGALINVEGYDMKVVINE
mgnify:CR=1 FL=1